LTGHEQFHGGGGGGANSGNGSGGFIMNDQGLQKGEEVIKAKIFKKMMRVTLLWGEIHTMNCSPPVDALGRSSSLIFEDRSGKAVVEEIPAISRKGQRFTAAV